MKLKDCVAPLVLKKVIGDINNEITGIEINSQKVKPGNLFIALRGYSVDGHQFIPQAIQQGAVAVLVEESIEESSVTSIIVPDTRKAMAMIACTFYEHPTKELSLIGVTGTNGKTTTSHMIESIMHHAGNRIGLIGTMQMKIGSELYAVKNTTPDSLELQKSFRMMRKASCDSAVIEVSSHALHMGRTWGSHFHVAVFTNLTQDHLDYHKTVEDYRAAKGLLFSQLAFDSFAVLNADDPASLYFKEITSAQIITYGIYQKADVWAEQIESTAKGTTFVVHTYLGSIKVQIQLIGQFNIYNVLAAITTAMIQKIPLQVIKQGVERIAGVSGRLERIEAGQAYTVIVDYAHTADSLENVLRTIQEFAKGRILCVVGCGGDRDRSKRPIMAKIATKYSNISIFTADNPRTEDPNVILLEMVEGVRNEDTAYRCIVDRREAIHFALESARENDVVLIAGKGHETYQEINGVRFEFDDREVAKSIMQGMNGDNDATYV